MRPSSSLPHHPQCPICQAALTQGAPFCSKCGARLEETPAEKLRSVNYLLAELSRWETARIITEEQAAALRHRYERQREFLRAEFAPSSGEQASVQARDSESLAESPGAQEDRKTATVRFPRAGPTIEADDHLAPTGTPRTLLETLSDPRNLRLLLYTGAAMIVVSVVLWLRDVLYLKLQEPVVQAGLLALATLAFMAAGWYAILRTRQRLTGRALTLTGSLLIPVNFWFLVRSGLIANNGRAWMVCALCALLYASTAALLRERLYVYLAACATIATAWALVFRAEREAFGLYALTSMLASLVFLHGARLFPLQANGGPATLEDEEEATGGGPSQRAVHESSVINGPQSQAGRWSYELWGGPLVRVGLVGATLGALLYLPTRLGPSLSFDDGLFHLLVNRYDPGMATVLFTAWAYAVWFAGRFIYRKRRVHAYLLSVLVLCWTELLVLDGLRLSARTSLLALSLSALALCLAHRLSRDEESALALDRASAIVSLLLLPFALLVILNAPALLWSHSISCAFLAGAFALLNGPRGNLKAAQSLFAYTSVLLASASFLIALESAQLRIETIFAASAVWPFALYAGAGLMRRRGAYSTPLAQAFARAADAEFVLLLLWAGVIAAFLYLDQSVTASWRGPTFYVLLAASLYGSLRAAREDSSFGAELASIAMLVLVAISVLTLRQSGVLPPSWPIAAFVICAAFLLPKANLLWLSSGPQGAAEQVSSPETRVGLVTDLAVIICGLLWFVWTVTGAGGGRFGAASVLLLALLYWCERTARGQRPWMANIAFVNAGAFFLALMLALRLDTRWLALAFALFVPPLFFAVGQQARARGLGWLTSQASGATWVAALLAFITAISQAAPHFTTGDPLLLAPCLTVGTLALLALIASLLAEGPERVRYFRAGLLAAIISFALGCLRAGYDPARDTEIYTSPVAIVLLLLSYFSVRREWREYERDTNALLWLGSLLLCVPLLFHALEFRLLLDVPAPWRDLGLLCAGLALILFGVFGRLRAPVIIGLTALLIELFVLALTSVEWTQVPLKVYLGTVGSLLMIAGWMLGFRREQLIAIRNRLNQRRERVQQRFGQWR